MATTEDQERAIAPLLTQEKSRTKTEHCTQKFRTPMIIVSVLVLIAIAITLIAVLTQSSSKSDSTDWKSVFLSIPNASLCMNYSKMFTDRPHLAATENNYYYAELFRDKLESFGITAEIQDFPNNLYSRYNSSSLTMLFTNGTIKEEFILRELIYSDDETSNTTFGEQAFLGYANSGNVTGNLIYVNYASRNDFELLLSLNYTLNGTIGLCRYGGQMYRGTKVYWAQQFGLKGLIIYSDPQQYVSQNRDLFPLNTSLPDSGFQRGSIIDGTCPGDISPERARNLCNKTLEESVPQIPAIPLSYGNAMKLFKSLSGIDVTRIIFLNNSWKGDLNITYYIGGNNDTIVNLQVNNIIVNGTTSNVIGYIPGYKYKNESILIGNHRDAWVYGAADPISGTTSLLEIARAFGTMHSNGWKPMRNIYFGSWDGEEYNLIGSTNFAEFKNEFVENELIAYINIDTSVSGYNLGLNSDQLLTKWLIDMTKEIRQPYTSNDDGITMYDAYNDESTGILGDGSDYVSFVHRFGIAAVSMGFNGLNDCYHSVYDSFKWMSLLDPKWELAKGMSLYAGLLAFYLTTNDILPYNVTYLVLQMYKWFDIDIYQIGIYANCNYQQINPNAVSILRESIDNFQIETNDFNTKINELNSNNIYEVMQLNEILRTLPSKFLYENGLPTRIYFRNLLVAPDLDSGYAAEPFPYVADALKFDCSSQYLMEAFNNTAFVIDVATQHLRDFNMRYR